MISYGPFVAYTVTGPVRNVRVIHDSEANEADQLISLQLIGTILPRAETGSRVHQGLELPESNITSSCSTSGCALSMKSLSGISWSGLRTAAIFPLNCSGILVLRETSVEPPESK